MVAAAANVRRVSERKALGEISQMNVLGIDIGGSAVKGAPVDTKTGKLLGDRYRIATPKKISPKELAKIVAKIAAHFQWKGPIGLGFPGVIRGATPTTSANLDKRFIGCDLAKLVSKATGSRVSVVNDADAAGIAEMRFGAGRKQNGTVILLTLGTGVGSALFYRGVLFPNSELGHFPLKGRDAEKYMAASVKEKEGLSWHKWGKRLSQYLQIVETILEPELIIIGGGVSADSDKYFKYLKTRVPVVPAQAKNQAGIVGAALWAAGESPDAR
ncbi:MAG: ROK family protein [Nibricoccus sp.]